MSGRGGRLKDVPSGVSRKVSSMFVVVESKILARTNGGAHKARGSGPLRFPPVRLLYI